jgi:hypothetical protein
LYSLPARFTRLQRSLVNRLPRLLSPLPQPICLPRHLLRRRRPQTDRLGLPPHNQAHPQARHPPTVGPSGHHLTHRVVGRRGERSRSLWKSSQVSHKEPGPCQGHANRRDTALPTVPRRENDPDHRSLHHFKVWLGSNQEYRKPWVSTFQSPCSKVSPGRLSRDEFHPPSTSSAHGVRLIHIHHSFRYVVYRSGDLRATFLWQQHRSQARK